MQFAWQQQAAEQQHTLQQVMREDMQRQLVAQMKAMHVVPQFQARGLAKRSIGHQMSITLAARAEQRTGACAGTATMVIKEHFAEKEKE